MSNLTPDSLRALLQQVWGDIERREGFGKEFGGLYAHADAWEKHIKRMNAAEDDRHELLAQIEALVNSRNNIHGDWFKALLRIEALERALRMQMEWIGPPHTDPNSYDSLREDAWAASVAALAAGEDK